MTFMKGSAVFIIVYFTLAILKSLSSDLKHIIWFVVICGFILIPLFSMNIPFLCFNVGKLSEERGEIYKAVTSLLFPQSDYSGTGQLSTQSGTVLSQMTVQAPHTTLHWSFWALMIWVTGILISSLRVIIGMNSLLYVCRGERLNKYKRYNHMLRQLSVNLGIDKKIVLIRNTKCTVPFTFNVVKPIVVLPFDIDNWPTEKLRVVLAHELAHIQRRDYLTQYMARMIVSIFWFIPSVWIAYSNLHIEQEMACDASVVLNGVKPADYAGHMLELAYFQRKRLLMVGLFIIKGKKMILEKRILNVLNMKRKSLLNKGGKKMKTGKLFLSVVSVFAVLFFIGTLATAENPISEEDFYKAFTGTWVNEDYSGGDGLEQKIINHPDGTWESYSKVYSKGWALSGKETITDKWTDSKGNIWYKAKGEILTVKFHYYRYGKINNSRNTWEYIISMGDNPIEKWEPDFQHSYHIYYRQ
jgi:beta-lactamase regulating signal transducer with metallopeptidase domain